MMWIDLWESNIVYFLQKKRPLDTPKGQFRYKVSPQAVTDQSFLPDALAPFCKGRPTYWLTPATADHGQFAVIETASYPAVWQQPL